MLFDWFSGLDMWRDRLSSMVCLELISVCLWFLRGKCVHDLFGWASFMVISASVLPVTKRILYEFNYVTVK